MAIEMYFILEGNLEEIHLIDGNISTVALQVGEYFGE